MLDDAAELLSGGVARVVVGTAAARATRVGGARSPPAGRTGWRSAWTTASGEVRIRGWTEGGGRRLEELVPEAVAAGAAAVIVTDIARDGRLTGPDVDGLAALLAQTGAPIIASGGVRDLDDVRALAPVGVPGASGWPA